MSEESYRGGTLEEMSARGGTSVPNEAGTQQIERSKVNPRSEAAYKANVTAPDISGVADNSAGMPASDEGLTGGVVTATGDQLPPDVEAKRMGMDTTGGKQQGAGRHTWKADRATERAVEGKLS